MTDGGASVENGRPEPTEVSPLLGSKNRDIDDHVASNGQNGGSNGSSHAHAHAHASAENGNDDDVDGGDGHGAGEQEEGVSKTTPKLHFLLPALAIGIFLSALDQTLIIATYAKMSSDLRALNRTSWISTA